MGSLGPEEGEEEDLSSGTAEEFPGDHSATTDDDQGEGPTDFGAHHASGDPDCEVCNIWQGPSGFSKLA